ncbi:baculoviral IAP repeat-containing protein 2-like [Lissotriton helveticus]
MNDNARSLQDAPCGAGSRIGDLAGLLLATDGCLHSVLEDPGKTYEYKRDGVRYKYGARKKMKRELDRLDSFERWPSAAQAFCADLASAGFFYVGPEDRVQCFSCQGMLNCRILRGAAMQEHRKYNPHCHFAMGRKVGNIPKPQPVVENPEASMRRMAARPDMAEACMREHSFLGWPKDKVHPRKLARAGFYTARSSSGDDEVWCFRCNIGISNWKRHHNPWKRHARHSPRCAFLNQEKGPDFIRAVQEQYRKSPRSSQGRGSSTTTCQGSGSYPAASSQSLAPGPSLDDLVTSRTFVVEHFEQTTQQKFQATLTEDVNSWDSFSYHVYLPSYRESLEFDLDDKAYEGLSSTPLQPSAFAAFVHMPWLDEYLASRRVQATQQILQGTFIKDVDSGDSFLSLICDGEFLSFDMDDVSIEE